MNSIDLMKSEHENILKLLAVIRNACCGVLEGKEVEIEDFRNMVFIARNYADKHHHGKEEEILFVEMIDHLGPVAANLIQHGMLVEHDMGRMHMKNLSEALDRYNEKKTTMEKLNILSNAAGYADLLERHIDKEDAAVYSYAERGLNDDIMNSVNERVSRFEGDKETASRKEKCLKLLETLLAKYK